MYPLKRILNTLQGSESSGVDSFPPPDGQFPRVLWEFKRIQIIQNSMEYDKPLESVYPFRVQRNTTDKCMLSMQEVNIM